MSTQSETINEIAAALAKAQGNMGNAVLNKINPHFKSKYADMAAVMDAIRGPLSSNGIAITSSMIVVPEGMVLRTMLVHSSGQFLATEYPLPAVARPQEMGSHLTYARRYSVSALVAGAADEDDDGNEAEKGGKGIGVGNVKVTKEQAGELAKLAAEIGMDVAAGLKKLGIAAWSDLPAGRYASVKQAMLDRAKKKAAFGDVVMTEVKEPK